MRDFSLALQPYLPVERLSDAELRYLASNTTERTVRRGEQVFRDPKEASAFTILRDGAVRLSRRRPGSSGEICLALLRPGDMFGALPVIGCGEEPLDASALDDSTVLAIRGGLMEELMFRQPDLARPIVEGIGRRLRQLEQQALQLFYKDARQRVAWVVLHLASGWGEAHPGGGTLIPLRVTHQDIASLAAITRETVSSILADFELQEYIATIGRKIVVLAPDELEQVVDGGRTEGPDDDAERLEPTGA